jgi:hypothetical protein
MQCAVTDSEEARLWPAMRLASVATVATLAMFATAAAQAGNVSSSGTRKEEITDAAYQMTAYTLEVPAGWKFAGTIARDPGCHSGAAGLKFTLQSPDGLTAQAVLPGVTWSWTTGASLKKIMEMQHCPPIDIDSAAGFLVNIVVPNLRPTAKIISVLALKPEGQAALAAQLEQIRQQNAQAAARYGQKPPTLSLDGARVRLEYTRDGQAIEEQLLAVVECTETQFPALYAQPAYMRRTCSSRNTQISRAPRGRLDGFLESPQLLTLNKSIQVNPAWSDRLTRDGQAAFQKFQAANNAQFQAGLERSRQQNAQLLANGQKFQDNMRASTNAAMANDQQRQNAIDASAHATALHSLDRQEFKNPSTGQTIEASNQYSHQWMSSDGSTLIQTNDHSYDPNGQVYPVSQSWTELVPK